MKLNKLALTLAAGCVIASTAWADTTIYINGSTAYRKSTYPAMQALFTTGGNTMDAGYPLGDASSTETGGSGITANPGAGAANWIMSGNLTVQGLGHVVLIANWAGSVSGQKSDAESDVWPTFLDPGTTAGTSFASEIYTGHVPDMNVSDNFQKTTTYFPPGDPTAVNLTRTAVAVIEFVVAKDANAPGTLTDITSLALREMYKVGYMNLVQLTGNSADNTNYVIPTGRDDDSGTRTVFEADNGIAFTAPLLQWGLHSVSVDSTAGYTPYQFGLASINANDGNGYSSGGTVGKVLADATGPGSILDPSGNTANNVKSYFIGYIGVADAFGVVPSSQFLSYNGVTYSAAACEEGQYTYWGTENADIRPAHNTGAIHTFYTAFVTAEQGQAGVLPGTEPITNLHVTRTADGGLISHN